MSAALSTWTGDLPIAYSYQWAKGDADILGANDSTYIVLAGDVGASTVRVMTTHAQGSSSVTSAPASTLPTNPVLHSDTLGQWTINSFAQTANVAVNNAMTADRLTETAAADTQSEASNAIISSRGRATCSRCM
ncbi:hypothetical protein [Bradyrhizobium sp. ORS 111]|uniref:hypothetical protein n=1 Tax=Bradyrhizobium sp. ORS 111 TaxID=1685958 RepID=UPI003890B8F3